MGTIKTLFSARVLAAFLWTALIAVLFLIMFEKIKPDNYTAISVTLFFVGAVLTSFYIASEGKKK